MKILNKEQIRTWDRYTIDHENITSLELMERASEAFVNWFTSLYFDTNRPISVIAGPGNNGGDGLAVARLLQEKGFQVHVHYMQFSKNTTRDNLANLHRLESVCHYLEFSSIPLKKNELVIDALLGTGIDGPARGEYQKVIECLNAMPNEIVSIDIPSGLNPDGHEQGVYVQCSRVLSFEIPKISFFTENLNGVSKPIGLAGHFPDGQDSEFKWITRELLSSFIRLRASNQGKHAFGFGQLCGGSPGMLGSTILASKAAMRCGLGRLSVSIPGIYHNAFLVSCPEAMVQADIMENRDCLSVFKPVNDRINGFAIGPGLGMQEASIAYVDAFLQSGRRACVLDADALNIIARKDWQNRIPKGSVITPHEKEFERLFGKSENRFRRVELQRQKSKDLGIFIVLKGANTAVTTPEGICYFNNTGNVGMATAGSGDVLTGMMLSFLCQCYDPLESALLAVYLHGLAGDHAVLKYGMISLIASDIVEYLPEVLKNLHGK